MHLLHQIMAIDVSKYDHCVPAGYPVLHRRKVPFNPRIVSPTGLSRMAGELRKLDAELDRFILRPNDFLELIIETWSQNIHQSVHMEGNPLTLREVERVTGDSLRGLGTQYKDRDRQEILNHVIVLSDPGSWGPPWTIETITGLHRFLFAGDPSVRAGELRTSVDAEEGTFGVWSPSNSQLLFRPAPAREVEEELSSLLEWRNTVAPVLFPAAAASVFFHEFESIHPFADGNGRLGRVLFHTYLQWEGLRNSNLCPIEPELTTDVDLYYRMLAWTDDRGEYSDLVEYFTEALLRSYETAVNRCSQRDSLSAALDEDAKRLLVRAKQKAGPFPAAEAATWVPSIGYLTLLKKLNHLVDEGVLEATGRTRSRRFRFVDPLAGFRDAQAAQRGSAPGSPQRPGEPAA